MKNIYFLLMLLGCPSVAMASEIPSIYRCTGAYVIPVTQISNSEFCQAVQQAPTDVKKIQLGGIPKANLEMSLSTGDGVQTRTFSLKNAMNFNDAVNSNYENMDLQDQNIVFDEIYKIIEKF